MGDAAHWAIKRRQRRWPVMAAFAALVDRVQKTASVRLVSRNLPPEVWRSPNGVWQDHGGVVSTKSYRYRWQTSRVTVAWWTEKDGTRHIVAEADRYTTSGPRLYGVMPLWPRDRVPDELLPLIVPTEWTESLKASGPCLTRAGEAADRGLETVAEMLRRRSKQLAAAEERSREMMRERLLQAERAERRRGWMRDGEVEIERLVAELIGDNHSSPSATIRNPHASVPSDN
jgi:hypothetical protein